MAPSASRYNAGSFRVRRSLTISAIDLTPSELDFSELHERMQWYVDQNILSCCATLVMRGTDVVDFATFGCMDLESGRPLAEDALFRIYSNTKVVTSVAAMMLVEAGQLKLDDPVADYLPGFASVRVLKPDAADIDDVELLAAPMRVRHLLSHSAGLSYGFVEPASIIDQAYVRAGLNALADKSVTLEGLCETLARLPLAYQPGTGWRYSFATDVVARLIEVVSGQRFDEFLNARIFSPLGMNDTGFWVPEEKRQRFTTLYAPTNLLEPMAGGLVKIDDPLEGAYTVEPAFLSGGAGLVSTVADYLVFLRMLANGGSWRGVRLLQARTLESMRANQLAPGVGVAFPMWYMPNTVFGLGFAVKQAPVEGETPLARGEYHWGGVAGTHSWLAPEANLAGLCFTQRMPGFWHPFSHDFKRLAYAIAAGNRGTV